VGTGTGTFTGSFYGDDFDNNQTYIDVPPTPISTGVVYTYQLNYAQATGSKLQVNAGFNGGGQNPQTVNKFLTYLNPTSSKTNLPAGTTSYPLIIVYDSSTIAS